MSYLDHPEDFKGHSLSIGDVVILSRGGNRQAGFVDIMGFKDLPGFLPVNGLEKKTGQMEKAEAARKSFSKSSYETKQKPTPIRRVEAVRL